MHITLPYHSELYRRHTCGASNDTSLLIYRLEELANDERYGLDPLHFFLGPKKLPSEIERLITDVLLPNQLRFRLAQPKTFPLAPEL